MESDDLGRSFASAVLGFWNARRITRCLLTYRRRREHAAHGAHRTRRDVDAGARLVGWRWLRALSGSAVADIGRARRTGGAVGGGAAGIGRVTLAEMTKLQSWQ